MISHCGDEKLIERCRRGDPAAQREVYLQTSARIYRLLLKMSRNRDDAFDLTQDTYIRAFSRLAQFDFKSSFETWLFRIAVNEALGFLRRTESGQQHLKNMARGPETNDPSESAVERMDVQEALASLEVDDRAILLLRYQESLDYRTIGQIIDEAEGTVASRLNRARAKLRMVLASSYSDEEGIGQAGHLSIRRGRRQ